MPPFLDSILFGWQTENQPKKKRKKFQRKETEKDNHFIIFVISLLRPDDIQIDVDYI